MSPVDWTLASSLFFHAHSLLEKGGPAYKNCAQEERPPVRTKSFGTLLVDADFAGREPGDLLKSSWKTTEALMQKNIKKAETLQSCTMAGNSVQTRKATKRLLGSPLNL